VGGEPCLDEPLFLVDPVIVTQLMDLFTRPQLEPEDVVRICNRTDLSSRTAARMSMRLCLFKHLGLAPVVWYLQAGNKVIPSNLFWAMPAVTGPQ
jgi:hypothetical protein